MKVDTEINLILIVTFKFHHSATDLVAMFSKTYTLLGAFFVESAHTWILYLLLSSQLPWH